MSNCAGISIKIGGTPYTASGIVGLIIPMGVELEVTDMSIVSGKDNANAIIIF